MERLWERLAGKAARAGKLHPDRTQIGAYWMCHVSALAERDDDQIRLPSRIFECSPTIRRMLRTVR